VKDNSLKPNDIIVDFYMGEIVSIFILLTLRNEFRTSSLWQIQSLYDSDTVASRYFYFEECKLVYMFNNEFKISGKKAHRRIVFYFGTQ
jgi:hypothetical protein